MPRLLDETGELMLELIEEGGHLRIASRSVAVRPRDGPRRMVSGRTLPGVLRREGLSGGRSQPSIGHGRSPTSKPLRKCSIGDYVDDVAEVADSLSRRPVVIGPTDGRLRRPEVPGYPTTPRWRAHGITSAGRFCGDDVAAECSATRGSSSNSTITGKQLPGLTPLPLAREVFFSAQTPEQVVVRCSTRLQEESARALAGTLSSKGIDLERIRTPLLGWGPSPMAGSRLERMGDGARVPHRG